MNRPRILIASDHAGFGLKSKLMAARPELAWVDLGPTSDARVDYPDYADTLVKRLLADNQAGSGTVGVLVCGSGQGMAMRANRYSQARAAIGWSEEAARLARAHNDANILCLGERLITTEGALAALNAFLSTEFEGGRHANRVNKLSLPC